MRRVLVLMTGMIALVAAVASAQGGAGAPPPAAGGNGYVEGVAQSAFGNVTSQSYGAEVGVTILPGLQVFVEGGRIGDVANAAVIGVAAQTIAAYLTRTQSGVVSYSIKQPATFGVAGLKYLIPLGSGRSPIGKAQPYVMAGVGIAKVQNNVAFTIGGTDVTANLQQYGVALGADLSGSVTKAMLTLGGGVTLPVWQRLILDFQYRSTAASSPTTRRSSRSARVSASALASDDQSGRRLPLRLHQLQRRMRYQEVPHDCLEGLTVGRDVVCVHGRNHHARVGDLCRVSAIAPDDAHDAGPDLSGEIDREDEVHADVFLAAAPANRQHEQHVLGLQPASLQPVHEDALPPFVVGPGGQLRDVVHRRVRLDAGDLPEIVHGVRTVRGAAADTKEEQPAAAGAKIAEEPDDFLDRVQVDGLDDTAGFLEVLLRVAHGVR